MQRNTRVWTLGLIVIVGMAVSGCGGGSKRSTGKGPTEQTRSFVQRHLGLHIGALSLSGAQSARFAEAWNGPGLGSTGFGMLGAFMKAASFAASSAGGKSEGDPGDGDDPEKPGWDGGPGFYYDEWLGLWVEVENTDNSSVFRLFEDEGKTKPAGQIVSTWPSDWEVYPQKHLYSYEITAGFMAGSEGSTEVLMESETEGRMTYSHTWMGGWRSEGSSTWKNKRYVWNNKSEGPDGTWSKDYGEFQEDGSGLVSSEDSSGYKSRFQYFPDGSAKGVIEGPDDGLPCTITWDSKGRVRIVWADGTVEEYEWGWAEPAVVMSDSRRR